MAAYKMAAVKVTPPNDFSLGLIRSHMVVIHLFLMLCDLQGVVRDLRSTLYYKLMPAVSKWRRVMVEKLIVSQLVIYSPHL
jgi:hypothetical protein